MDLEWSYEIDRTVDYIHCRNFTRIALQFPDELLKDSTRVVRALRDNLRSKKESGCESNGEGREVGLYVMADTAYGSCCVDEVGASHINAECVVHYGHTCLSQTTTLPALFVFGKAPISVSSCIESICNVGSKCDKSIVVLYGLEYAYAVNDIKEAVTVETPALSHSKSKSKIYYADVACSSMEPSKDHVIPNGQINVVRNVAGSNESDSDGHTRCSVGGLTWSLPLGERIEDFLLFWIGSDNSAFANLVLTFNSCEIVRYDAAENRILTDHFQKTRILKRRYYLVEKAKDANIVGILVGTLGVAGYLQMIDQMKQLVTRAGKKPYMLVMGRPNPAKLANFPECDVFIYVSCAQTALLDSKEFLAPVITPFEAMLAFSRGSQWTGQYTIEFRDLISASALEAQCETDEARFSFFHGGYVEDLDDEGNGEDVDEALALALATEKALQVHDKTSRSLVNATPKSGPEFLAARSYQGLGSCDENPTPSAFLIGRTGRASGYEDEKTQERFS